MVSSASLRSSGTMFIFSSPSGAGKSSIARAIIEEDSHIKLSISVTTRPKRPGEVDGVDYYFVSDSKFTDLINEGAFIEYAGVFGNKYGTLASEVFPYLEKGIDVVFDVDWQGARSLRANSLANSVVGIYILPPSIQELRVRLVKRMQDDMGVISDRMMRAIDEMSHYAEYDYVVVNNHFTDALSQVKSIINAERLKIDKLDLLADKVSAMCIEK